MNPLLYPSKEGKQKTLVGKFKPGEGPPPKPSGMRDSIPNSWYFADNAETIWSDLEANSISQRYKKPQNDNPFQEVDEAAHKIRTLIDNYELSDHDFLSNLMDMLDGDAAVENFDQSGVLLEARFRLASMITEHVDNSTAQVQLLDSLRYWFTAIKSHSQQSLDSDVPKLRDHEDGINTESLARLINEALRQHEETAEHATALHHDIIDALERTIQAQTKEIAFKDGEIQNLRNSLDQIQKPKGRRTPLPKVRLNKDQQMQQQRRITEQEMQIASLKSSLQQNRTDAKQGVGDDIPSVSSSRRSESVDELGTDKEFEYETRIRILIDQLATNKEETEKLQTNVKELKLSQIQANHQLQTAERLRKNYEQTLQNEREKYSFMEETYKKKIEDISNKPVENDESRVVTDIRKEYETKLEDLKEQHRAQQLAGMEQMEKRHRAQISELVAAMNVGGEGNSAAEIILNQQEIRGQEMKKEYQKQIADLKQGNTEKLTSLTQAYEKKLSKMRQEQQTLIQDFESDLNGRLKQLESQLAERFRAEIAEESRKSAEEQSELYRKMQSRVEMHQSQIKRLTNERNALRTIVESLDGASNIPLTEELDETEIEPEQLEEIQICDPNVIRKQVQAEMAQKNAQELEFQRSSLLQTKEWEIKQIKKSMRSEHEKQLALMKENILSHIKENKNVDGILEIMDVTQTKPVPTEVMIPMSEVNQRTSTLEKLLQKAETENSFLKSTLSQISGRKMEDGDEDILAAMRTALDEQTEKTNQILQENHKLHEKIRALKAENDMIQSEPVLNLSQPNMLLEVPPSVLSNQAPSMPTIPQSDLEPAKPIFHRSARKHEIWDMTPFAIAGLVKLDIPPAFAVEMFEDGEEGDEIFAPAPPSSPTSVTYHSIQPLNPTVELPIEPPRLSSSSPQYMRSDSLNSPERLPMKQNDLMPSDPQFELNLPYKKLVCQHCHAEIDMDPRSLQVATLVPPPIECPNCASPVSVEDQIALTDPAVENPYPPSNFTDEQLASIKTSENEIKLKIQELINLKKEMRANPTPIQNPNSLPLDTLPSYDDQTVEPPSVISPLPTLSGRISHNSSGRRFARTFSPSEPVVFSIEAVEAIEQAEREIDAKIESLFDFKASSQEKCVFNVLPPFVIFRNSPILHPVETGNDSTDILIKELQDEVSLLKKREFQERRSSRVSFKMSGEGKAGSMSKIKPQICAEGPPGMSLAQTRTVKTAWSVPSNNSPLVNLIGNEKEVQRLQPGQSLAEALGAPIQPDPNFEEISAPPAGHNLGEFLKKEQEQRKYQLKLAPLGDGISLRQSSSTPDVKILSPKIESLADVIAGPGIHTLPPGQSLLQAFSQVEENKQKQLIKKQQQQQQQQQPKEQGQEPKPLIQESGEFDQTLQSGQPHPNPVEEFHTLQPGQLLSEAFRNTGSVKSLKPGQSLSEAFGSASQPVRRSMSDERLEPSFDPDEVITDFDTDEIQPAVPGYINGRRQPTLAEAYAKRPPPRQGKIVELPPDAIPQQEFHKVLPGQSLYEALGEPLPPGETIESTKMFIPFEERQAATHKEQPQQQQQQYQQRHTSVIVHQPSSTIEQVPHNSIGVNTDPNTKSLREVAKASVDEYLDTKKRVLQMSDFRTLHWPLSVKDQDILSSRSNGKEIVEVQIVREIIGEPRSVAEAQNDLAKVRTELEAAKGIVKLYHNSIQDCEASVRDLMERHQEIINVLSKTVKSAYDLAKGTEHPEALIERMQEQSAYLTNVIMEKESMKSVADDTNRLLNQRSRELVVIQEECNSKDDIVITLESKLKEATNSLQNLSLVELERNSTLQTLEESDEIQKKEIERLTNEVTQIRDQKHLLEIEIEKTNLKNEELKSRLVIFETGKQPPKYLASPWVIFEIVPVPTAEPSAPEPQQVVVRVPLENQFSASFEIMPTQAILPSIAPPLVIEAPPAILSPSSPLPGKPSSQRASGVITISANNSSQPKLIAPKPPKALLPAPAQNPHQTRSEPSSGRMINVQNSQKPPPAPFNTPNTNKTKPLPPIQYVENSNEPRPMSRNSTGEFKLSVSGNTSGVLTSHGKPIGIQEKMRKRVENLEVKLNDKCRDLLLTREELHVAQQGLTRLKTDFSKLETEYTRLLNGSETTKKRLSTALGTIVQLTNQNNELQNILEKARTGSMNSRIHQRLRQMASEQRHLINVTMQDEMEMVHRLEDMYDQSDALRSLAKRHAAVVARLENQRRGFQESERDHTMRILEAMKLIDGTQPETTTPLNEVEERDSEFPGMKIKNIQGDMNANERQTYESEEAPIDTTLPSYEEALIQSNAHNPKLAKELRRGIVANPLKM